MNGFFKLLNTTYDKKRFAHNVAFFTALLLLALLCLCALPNVKECHEYPLKNVYMQYDQYALQFNAFVNGHIELDAVPPEELAELDNPYDPSSRGRISYLWDIAYYGGNYYSYFGIAPIITVYYPVFLLTGMIASKSLACLILGICAVLFVGLAYRELVLRFCDEPNLILTVAGLVAVVFASGAYIGISYSDTYYIAVLSALECSSAVVFLSFRAMRTKKLAPRAVLLALAALALTLAVWSRPTAALMCLVILPTFIGFAAGIKRNTLKEGIVTVASFVLPLCLGAAAVMIYNAVRFSSPFDFGSNYQLTVSDISKNTLSLSLFFPAIGSFFLQLPEHKAGFPFVGWSKYRFATFGDNVRYIYHDSTVGAFAFGLPIASFFAPFAVDRRKDKVKTATLLLLPPLAVLVAFADYCLAGVNVRYLLDILPLLSSVSAVVCLELHSKSSGKLRGALGMLCLLLFGTAVIMCLGLIFCNANDLLFH